VRTAVVLLIKAVNGGLFVVAFALIGEMARPKRFAGLFSAAPSVALANLAVTSVADGTAKAAVNCRGMVVGGLALMLACLGGVVLIRRLRAVRASVVVCATWLAAAETGYLAVLR